MREIYTHIDRVSQKIEEVAHSTEANIVLVRESFFKRFPSIPILLATFGVCATFFGIERIISQIFWLNDRPFLIFCVGILTLIVTGTLYKKLG